MNPIIEKIEALPESKTLCYAVMTGMTVEGYNSSHITTAKLHQLAREYRALIAVLEAAEKLSPSTGQITKYPPFNNPFQDAIAEARRVIEGGRDVGTVQG